MVCCENRLDTLDESDLLKFGRGKSEVLPLGRNKAVDQFELTGQTRTWGSQQTTVLTMRQEMYCDKKSQQLLGLH